ncbi:MAG: DUF444 family protein, partial [Planctomycetaceae bacterium]|nr:DUF444 family protein [Planctomycetaceae bacterium]
MAQKIDKDYARFRNIVKGRIRKELRKYMSQGELVARKKGGKVSIPLPSIDLPRFKFNTRQKGGVGQGEGDVGDPVDAQQGEGQPGEAGEQPGEHGMDVDVTLEELAEILGEELKLPRIEPKGKKTLETTKHRFAGIRQTGPESLRHFKRTYKQSLRRAIMSGMYDPENPILIPEREDRRYRGWSESIVPENSAVMIYMMDVSGSMGDEQKEIVRI